MIESKAQVVLMDKNRLTNEVIEVLNSLDNIYITFRKLKHQENLCFGDIEASMKLTRAIINYIKALNARRDDLRDKSIDDMKSIVEKDMPLKDEIDIKPLSKDKEKIRYEGKRKIDK
ncbi:hypothetical protein HYH39_06750 [Clostridium botulinum]|nr:hypothetical protein KU40_04575 [Clostridium botulinum]MBY6778639.1 hypothetical protein [Clostridium botulinum]MBY6851818.1 hypothetical protein [Clostridium botulinum]NFH69069.1 hypothetical protein [Clostridium botulinum]NFM10381.1 hypothetical protein [Clostridium botulinum]